MRPGHLFLAAAAAALLASCSNNPYPEADDKARVLYLAYPIAPKTLDPAVGYSIYDHQVTGNIFATLLEYHYLDRPYRLIPSLAEAIPQGRPADDGRIAYRFALRPGLLFDEDECFALSGDQRRTRNVTAADVAFAIMRIADPDVASPVVDTFAKLDGFREFADRLRALRRADASFGALRIDVQYQRAGGIPGARALNDTEIEIVLREPYPQILYWFAMPFTAPVPWEAVAFYDGRDGRDNFPDHPIATGPFRLRHYERRSRIVLERNPNWYGVRHPEWRAPGTVYPASSDGPLGAKPDTDVAGRPLPFLDRVELRRDPEVVPAFMKFLQGYYDQSPIVRESFDRIVRQGALTADVAARGLQLDRVIEATVYYLGFNMDDPVVGRAAGARGRALRQAMSLAIDAEELLRIFTNGRGLAAQSPLPPDIFGYDPAYRNPFRTVDLGRAAALLAEAGYPNGIDPATNRPLRLSFDVNDTASRSLLMFQFLRDSWKPLGLDVVISAIDYNAYQDKMRRGAYQLFYWGWGADYPDPENFLFLLYGPMGRTQNGGPNDTNFADPRYDELFVQMRARPNGPERAALIAEMRGILERECPWIPLFHREEYTLNQPWLHHAKASALTLPVEKYLDVDPAARADLRTAWNEPVRWPAYALLLVAAAVVAPAARRAWLSGR